MSPAPLKRFRELSGDEQKVLIEAWTLLPVVDVSLRIASYKTTRGVVRALLGLSPRIASVGGDPERASYLIDVAGRRHAWHIRCLPRSMVLEGMLRRSGFECELRIGARRRGDELSAHAWVEREGRAIGEAGNVEDRFHPLLRGDR